MEVVSLLGGEDEVNVPLKMPFLGAASLVGQISSPGGGVQDILPALPTAPSPAGGATSP